MSEEVVEGQGLSRNESRRSFLKRLGKTAVVASLLAPGILAASTKETSSANDSETAETNTPPELPCCQQTNAQEMSHRTFVPGATRSVPTEEEVSQIEGFDWKRNEVLFGKDAGFSKARNGESITVGKSGDIDNLNLAESIQPWNDLALQLGRNTPLFRLAEQDEAIDVVFSPTEEATLVVPNPSYEDDYKSVTIHMRSYGSEGHSIHVARHELGHALGIVDFITEDTDPTGYVNPQYGDGDKEYTGVMNYKDWYYAEERWFGEGDQQLLTISGYIPLPEAEN